MVLPPWYTWILGRPFVFFWVGERFMAFRLVFFIKDHEKNRFSPKTIVLVGNFDNPKLGTIILIVLDFQGYCVVVTFNSRGQVKDVEVDPWNLQNTLQTKRKSHLKMDGLKLEDELPFGMAYSLGPYFALKGVYMFLFFRLSFHPTFFCGPKIHNGRWYTWATPTKILTLHSESIGIILVA